MTTFSPGRDIAPHRLQGWGFRRTKEPRREIHCSCSSMVRLTAIELTPVHETRSASGLGVERGVMALDNFTPQNKCGAKRHALQGQTSKPSIREATSPSPNAASGEPDRQRQEADQDEASTIEALDRGEVTRSNNREPSRGQDLRPGRGPSQESNSAQYVEHGRETPSRSNSI